jgi:hypothetical protein
MKKIFHYNGDFLIVLISFIIGLIPRIVLFLLLYLINYIILPNLPFSIFILFLYILIIIYDKIKKSINKET